MKTNDPLNCQEKFHYLEADAKLIPVRNKVYVFHSDVIDYWRTVPVVIMDSLPPRILNIRANQTEIVGVDVGVACWML